MSVGEEHHKQQLQYIHRRFTLLLDISSNNSVRCFFPYRPQQVLPLAVGTPPIPDID